MSIPGEEVVNSPIVDLGFARVDSKRTRRQGMPEVVLCVGKTPSQVAKILDVLVKSEGLGIATKATPQIYSYVRKQIPQAQFYPDARIIAAGKAVTPHANSTIVVVSAGTSDLPIAEEAAVTAMLLGHNVGRVYDAGVAGLHRILSELGTLRNASVVIVVAGMDGALASVVAGLVDMPVIAVPTSRGYGATFKGLSALLSMLAACVPGVAVVNIDNGFGAAALAHRMARSNNKMRIQANRCA
jgi:NCAIR mutase (PurE)-related protein